MAEQLIEAVVHGAGSTLLRVDDVTTTAIELADGIPGCELVEGADAFVTSIERGREGSARRVAARAALALHARAADASVADPHVVNDVAGLRSLIDRLEDAEGLVEASRGDARDRAGAATGLAVHPTSIRDAAADVLDARADVLERQADVDRLPARSPEHDAPVPEDTSENESDDVGASVMSRDRTSGRLALADNDEVRRAAIVVVISLVIGIVVVVAAGSPLALVLPGVAVCWFVVVVVRQRDSAYDEEIASRNLASVARLTDRAYGGAGLVDSGSAAHQDPSLLEAHRALSQAADRLAYAESAWRSLVGPDVDVDDVESVVQARDAQYGVSDAIVDEMPSFRAASAHARRLRAQWKLAWWALDRPIPAPEGAVEALAALEADGVDEIVVEGRPIGGLTPQERERLDDLAEGRSVAELETLATTTFPVVIVADAEGAIDEDRLRNETAQLPDDVRFVVVAPAD